MNYSLQRLLKPSLVVGLLMWCTFTHASTIDSLLMQVKTLRDTAKIDAYNELSYLSRNTDIEVSLLYADTALQLSKKKEYTRGIGNAYVNIGNYHRIIGDNNRARACYSWAYIHHEKAGNLKGISSTLNCIASTYFIETNFKRALKYFILSLNISQKINDRRGVAITLNNIGVINLELRNFSKALEYYEEAYNTFKELNDRNSMADALNNIGNIYHTQGLRPEALKYYYQSLEMTKELGNLKGESFVVNNIGMIMLENKDYKQALKYYMQSLSINKTLNDKQSNTITYINIAESYYNLDMFYAAKKHAEEGLVGALEQGDKISVSKAYLTLSKIYDKLGDYKLALEHYKKHTAYNDSIYNEENRQQLEDIESKFEAEKEENERLMKELSSQRDQSGEGTKEGFTWKVWTILIGVVVVAIGLMWYFFKRNK